MASIGEASTFQALINLLKSKFVQKETGKGLFSGSYNDLSDKPAALPASDVYAWAKAATKPTYIPIEVGAISVSQIGIAGGVASLDSSGKVPSSQVDLPTNIATLDGNNKLQDSQTNYVSTGRKSGTTVGNCSTAEGYKTTSSAQYAHAEGNQTHATASAAHAEGCGTQATSQNTHAEGWDTTASSSAAHSEGYNTAASAAYSHAEGHLSKAQHARSHAEGYNTQTGAEAQHVQGQYNVGKSDTAMEIGWGTSNVNRINVFEVYQNGDVVAAGNITDGSGNTLANMLAVSQVGIAGGVASLDSNGHVPSSQIPGTVDEIKEGYLNSTDGKFYEESTYTTEIPAASDKIYVDLSTNKTYRWGGSAYVEISASLALGDTSTTAFAGNRGKAIEDCVPNGASASNQFATAGDISDLVANNIEPISLCVPSGASASNKFATADDISNVSNAVNGIAECIPSGASSSNQFATMNDIDTAITQVLAASY